jgi:hypothetical protein
MKKISNKIALIIITFVGIFFLFISVVLFFAPSQPSLAPSTPPTPTLIQVNPTTSPGETQGQLDRNYTQKVNEFYKTYPWYDQIPPRNENYFIGFDSFTKSFFIELYPKNTSSTSADIQVSQLKNTVLQTLQSIGVNTTSYKIEWIIVPQ